MRFIQACKYNYILWWDAHAQKKLNPKLMGECKGMAPCEPQTDAWCRQSPAPAMPPPPRSGASALNQELWRHASRTERFKLMLKPSVEAAWHCRMAAVRDHTHVHGHWHSHAWVEQDRGGSSTFQWGQGIFQHRSSRLAHRTHVSACVYLHVAFFLLLLATSVLFVGLWTLSPWYLKKKCKEFLFENISSNVEAVV